MDFVLWLYPGCHVIAQHGELSPSWKGSATVWRLGHGWVMLWGGEALLGHGQVMPWVRVRVGDALGWGSSVGVWVGDALGRGAGG